MLSPDQIAHVRSSYKAIAVRKPELFEDFYTRLFVLMPETRAMFPNDIEVQSSKLESAIQIVLSALSNPEPMRPLLLDLGRAHAGFGVTEGQYHLLSEILLDTLAACAEDDWSPEISAAWGSVLAFVTNCMIEGSRSAAAIPA